MGGACSHPVFRPVFERYYRELLNFLAHKVRDCDVASDLAQESYARVYAAERAGTRVRDPRALLYRTARNLLTDRYRRDATAAQFQGADSAEVEPDTQQGPAVHEPEVALATRQHFERIAQVVDGLPPRCREAFILVKFDGLSHAETAQRMGISVKTVEMQIQIALRACWDCMDSLEGMAPRAEAASPARAVRKRGPGTQ
ncbi:MAG: sigma-70 family RNA polymerase sigma factor [Acidovorax sp.]|nr:sigma-70 family RNA polymerase sigma factor [Acidovorax sp.]